MPHITQSRPDSGLVFQVKVRETLKVVPSLLGSGQEVSVVLPQKGKRREAYGFISHNVLIKWF